MAYEFRRAGILIVDDMLPMLALTESLLRIFGFTDVHKAHSADEGFSLFCRYSPDIVLTDWLMDPYDGIELSRKIRNDPMSPNKFVPIVMMTGYSHRIRVMEARDAGVTEFLVKPFRAKDLYARIEQLIEKPRKFVDAAEFFGPDRRRRKADEYQGPKRREVDEFAMATGGDNEGAAEILRDLQEHVKQAARTSKTRKSDE